MLTDDTQRHFLNKADVDTVIDREPNQIVHFQMVPVLKNDRIDFYPLKPCRLGSLNAPKHLVQIAGSGYRLKLVGIQRIQADIDAFYARLF